MDIRDTSRYEGEKTAEIHHLLLMPLRAAPHAHPHSSVSDTHVSRGYRETAIKSPPKPAIEMVEETSNDDDGSGGVLDDRKCIVS